MKVFGFEPETCNLQIKDTLNFKEVKNVINIVTGFPMCDI